jgi:hypothetical protein
MPCTVSLVKNIHHLRQVFDEFNKAHFEGLLTPITILIKRNMSRDGYLQYRGRQDWTPIREEIKRSAIVLSQDIWDEEDKWGILYGTLLHEMIHLYQIDVLNCAPHHDERFNTFAEILEEKTGYDIK